MTVLPTADIWWPCGEVINCRFADVTRNSSCPPPPRRWLGIKECRFEAADSVKSTLRDVNNDKYRPTHITGSHCRDNLPTPRWQTASQWITEMSSQSSLSRQRGINYTFHRSQRTCKLSTTHCRALISLLSQLSLAPTLQYTKIKLMTSGGSYSENVLSLILSLLSLLCRSLLISVKPA